MTRYSTLFLCFVLIILTIGLTSAQVLPGNMIGMLGAAFRDYRDGTSTVDYTLYTFDGAKVPLSISENVIEAAGGFFSLQESPVEIVLAPPTQDGRLSAAAIHPTVSGRWYEVNPVGTIPWTFLLCTFNNITDVPISTSDVEIMTGNTDFGLGAYWSQTSHGITTTDTTVYDWANIGRKRAYYVRKDPLLAINAYLNDCPAAHGITLSGSFNIAIATNDRMFSQDFALGLYGYDGTNIQRAIFLPDWAITNHNIIAHQMGHTYGLPHSNNYDWDSDPYDNPWDLMSGSFQTFAEAPYGTIATPTNTFFYNKIGMLPEENIFKFASLGRSTTITIDDWMTSDSQNYKAAFIYGLNYQSNFNDLQYVVEVHKGSTGGFNSGYSPFGVTTDAVIIYEVSHHEDSPLKLIGGWNNKKITT